MLATTRSNFSLSAKKPQRTAPRRLMVVSNLLPVSVEQEGKRYRYQPVAGALATGLEAVSRERRMRWPGWRVARAGCSSVKLGEAAMCCISPEKAVELRLDLSLCLRLNRCQILYPTLLEESESSIRSTRTTLD